jgi:hypothetical protein
MSQALGLLGKAVICGNDINFTSKEKSAKVAKRRGQRDSIEELDVSAGIGVVRLFVAGE